MSKKPENTVKVAELKARLSAYLRAARQGHAVTVCDRDTPVARLVPYRQPGTTLPSKPATRKWGKMKMPAPVGRTIDSLGALLEEREPSR